MVDQRNARGAPSHRCRLRLESGIIAGLDQGWHREPFGARQTGPADPNDLDHRVGQGGGDPEIGGHIPAVSEFALYVTWRHWCTKIRPELCRDPTDGTSHGPDLQRSESPTR